MFIFDAMGVIADSEQQAEHRHGPPHFQLISRAARAATHGTRYWPHITYALPYTLTRAISSSPFNMRSVITYT